MQSRGGEGGDPVVPDGNVVIDRKGIQRNMRSEVLKDGATENPVESGRPQPWLLSGPLVGVIIEDVPKLPDSVRGGASLEVVCGLGFQLVDRMIKKLKSDLEWTQPEGSCQSLQQLDAGLVRVKMRPSGNDGRAGVIKPLARLYWNPNKNVRSASVPFFFLSFFAPSVRAQY